MKCWHDLTITPSTSFFNSTWELPSIDTSKPFVKRFLAESIFSKDFLNQFDDLNLSINSALVFYKPAFYKNKDAHIDLINESMAAIYAINWILSGDNSTMMWYETPSKSVELKKTEAKTNYISWPISDLTLIDTCSISKNVATLVRVDIPHSINVDQEPRWSISIRCKLQFSSWENTVEYFKNQKLIFN